MESSKKKKLQPISREDFEQAANEAGTDKGSGHGYQRFYPLALSQIDRNEEFTLVEIGYGDGKSIPMWRALFPNSYIICLDRDVSIEGEGYEVIQADQGEPTSLLDAIGKTKLPVRLIIDDGSHHPEHQLTSFSLLFENILDPGGYYIIEDIETSYWLAGNLYGHEMHFGLFCRWSAIETLKLMADYVNRTFISQKDKSLLEYSMMLAGLSPSAAEDVSSITFAQNCVLLEKMRKGDKSRTDRPYWYAECTSRD